MFIARIPIRWLYQPGNNDASLRCFMFRNIAAFSAPRAGCGDQLKENGVRTLRFAITGSIHAVPGIRD